jgi:Zn-dependent peptidase ImmA (M78 family)
VKNAFLRDRTARDIDDQVAKVLRDLGHPDPPINLNDVRELLRLDRQYYSSTEDGALREVAHRLTLAGKQIIARPALLLDVIKKFDLRALYIPDGKRILLDSNLPDAKQRWSEGHEIGHSIIPWHFDTMLGDDKRTLTPACHAQMENEANYAAGQLLFCQEKFIRDARDLRPELDSITKLKKRFGNTITTTLWRYVEQSEKPMIGAISCHPHRRPPEFDANTPFRYLVGSRSFQQQFSGVSEVDLFTRIKNYCSNRRGGPLGSRELVLRDDNGTAHVFQFETFFNQHEALTLGVYRDAYGISISTSP